MKGYSLSHLSDSALDRALPAVAARDHASTAELLAHIAEFDERKRYLPAGYASMFAYCVGSLHFSEDAAYKRIQAARIARGFPAIFPALASGRVHLTGVNLLAPHLTEESAGALLEAATHKSKAEIERLLAERYPRPELPARVQAIPLPAPTFSVEGLAPAQVEPPEVPELAPAARAPVPAGRPRITPLAPQSFAIQFTADQEAHDLLCYAWELLGHEVASGDIAAVFKLALVDLIARLEKRKFAATGRPRAPRRSCAGSRHIPAHVKRAVWVRDGGRCTFVSEGGHRCQERRALEYDHGSGRGSCSGKEGRRGGRGLPRASTNTPRGVSGHMTHGYGSGCPMRHTTRA